MGDPWRASTESDEDEEDELWLLHKPPDALDTSWLDASDDDEAHAVAKTDGERDASSDDSAIFIPRRRGRPKGSIKPMI